MWEWVKHWEKKYVSTYGVVGYRSHDFSIKKSLSSFCNFFFNSVMGNRRNSNDIVRWLKCMSRILKRDEWCFYSAFLGLWSANLLTFFSFHYTFFFWFSLLLLLFYDTMPKVEWCCEMNTKKKNRCHYKR